MTTEIETLRVQVATMRKIIRIAWNNARNGYDYDGGNIQDDLYNAGLLEKRPATESDTQIYDCEVGDTVYSPTRLMTA